MVCSIIILFICLQKLAFKLKSKGIIRYCVTNMSHCKLCKKIKTKEIDEILRLTRLNLFRYFIIWSYTIIHSIMTSWICASIGFIEWYFGKTFNLFTSSKFSQKTLCNLNFRFNTYWKNRIELIWPVKLRKSIANNFIAF